MKQASCKHTRIIHAPAQKVWRVLADYSDLRWSYGYGVKGCRSVGSGLGMVRYPLLETGKELQEKLIEYDEKEQRLAYQIIDGNFIESKNYTARIHVTSANNDSSVYYHCTAEFATEQFEQGQQNLNACVYGMAEVFTAYFD